jgi:glycine oxidase
MVGINSDTKFDVAIIGGGVIGCSIAWRLAQRGVRAVIIERNQPGLEASWAAGGMLAPFAEADSADGFFHLAVESRSLYPSLVAELESLTGIDIEYRSDGTLFLALNDEDEKELAERFEWQRNAGLRIDRLDAGSVHDLEPLVTDKVRWALRFPDDHQLNNRQLLKALSAAARSAGTTVLENTEVTSLIIERNRVTRVATNAGEIQVGAVVVAAGCWTSLIKGSRYLSEIAIKPVRGQMLAFAAPSPSLRMVIYSRRGYLIPRAAGFMIAGSTAEDAGFEKALTAGGVEQIIRNAVEIMPSVGKLAIVESWSGLRPGTPDDWPVIGSDPETQGLFFATGHYRNGILLAPVTAEILTELIVSGGSKRDLTDFSVSRFTHRVVSR